MLSEIEANIHQARRDVNERIKQLVNVAIEDSSTYDEAIKNLNTFKWNFSDKTGVLIIESAIEKIKKKALMTEI
ncbi:hypothetical protein HXA35_15680 [Bacillus sp. A301a_S52]|jgi:hypothetical protein|nr:hypothetical protein [Bacillus sp. A301a_S52]UJW58772.1 hypothetical protein HXZ66_15770 [Bacillus sp. A116_S68]